MLNETWLKDNQLFSIPGYNFINKNAKNKHGGVGILIKNTIKYNIIPTSFYQDVQTVAVSILTEFGPLSILCVYCPPRSSNNIHIFNKLRNIISNLPKPCVIAGDFNAHHVAFGCSTTQSRGRELLQIFDDENLCFLNSGSATTVGRPNCNASAIDISCVSPMLAPLCEWRVGDDPLGSYHYPTFIDILTSASNYKSNNDLVRKYLFHKANWSQYYELSENIFDEFLFSSDPIINYNNFCEKLNILKEKCIPVWKPKHRKSPISPAPWWNKECERAVKSSKEALLNYRNSLTMETYIEYKRLDAIKKRVIKEAKKDSWHKLCDSFNRNTPISTIWNYMRKFKRIYTDRNIYRNDEWVPQFIKKLALQSNSSNISMDSIFNSGNEVEENQFLLKEFSVEELNVALKSRKNTTPGLDNIPYVMISKLHPNAKSILVKILNLLWVNQIIPESWKVQCVIPVLKAGKPADDYQSYRPISLSSCVGKLLEQMIKLRLDYFVERNQLIPKFQFGFRKGKSCSESFVSYLEDMKKCILSKSVAICAFLDVQGAYDNVDLHQLSHILCKIGLPGKLIKWIFNFSFERTLYVKCNIMHGPEKVFKGLMQGATLSPLLYNLYTSELNKYIRSDVKILQFADDILIYSVNRNVNIASNNLNKALNDLYLYYFNELKLNINSSKSSAMIFGDNTHVNIVYNNELIPVVSEKKFLGVIFDVKLKFINHINYIIKNSMRGINILRSLAGTSWGSDPKILTTLYKSLVRSHFDYSCLAYLSASVTVLKKLDIIQNMALRIISGAMRTTPINSMEVETCIEPLAIRRLHLAERFFVKVLTLDNSIVASKFHLPTALCGSLQDSPNVTALDIFNGQSPVMLKVIKHIENMVVNMYKSNLLPLYSCKYTALMKPVLVDFSIVNDNYEYLEFLSRKNNTYRIYTDGSKSLDFVAAAFYDPQKKVTKSYKIDSICSIFTAEAYAIYQALLYISNSITIDNSFHEILIVSDSKSLLAAIENDCINFKTNYLIFFIKDILENLDKCVTFKWVPSHKGITGNEIVDQAANSQSNIDHTQIFKIPFTDYYEKLKNTKQELWNTLWNICSLNKGRWYAEIQKTLPKKPWYSISQYASERKFYTTINRLRFGHCKTPSHLKRMKIVNSAACSHCGDEDADLTHFIMSCPSFNIQRLALAAEISTLLSGVEDEARPVQQMLGSYDCYRTLYQFIVSTLGEI